MALPPCQFLTLMSFSDSKRFSAASFGRGRKHAGKIPKWPFLWNHSHATIPMAPAFSSTGVFGATEGEISMQRKILALAAAAALGAAMTTGAMAAHMGGGGGGGGGRGMSMGGGGHAMTMGGGHAMTMGGGARMSTFAVAPHGSFVAPHSNFATRASPVTALSERGDIPPPAPGQTAPGLAAIGATITTTATSSLAAPWASMPSAAMTATAGPTTAIRTIAATITATLGSNAAKRRAPRPKRARRFCLRVYLYAQPKRPRSCGSVKSISGPIGTIPVGLILRWLP